MGETGGEVAHLAGVYYQHIVAQRLVMVLFQVDVVELWNVVLELLFLENFLDEVFPVVPPPRLVELSEILHDESALLYPLLVDANRSLALRVHSEASLVLC